MSIDLKDVEVKRRTGNIYLAEVGLSLTKNKHLYIIDKHLYPVVKKITIRLDGKWDYDKNGQLSIKFNDIIINVYDRTDIEVINDIFIMHMYAFYPLDTKIIVLDIGMNHGIASLYFASKREVVKVIGYEPVPTTFHKALANFNLNPDLSNKITPTNTGVGESNKSSTLYYYPESSGQSSIYATNLNRTVTENIQIEILSATEILHDLITHNPKYSIFVKIDCEGSEYEIIRSLVSNKIINKIHAMVMEWHTMNDHQNPCELIELLHKSGFIAFSFSFDTTGMIYAINHNK